MDRARIAVSLAVAALAATAGAQQPEQHVRGVVASVSGDTVVVTSPDGRSKTTLKLADKTFVAYAAKADLNAIKENAFIGTAAVPGPGGALKALEVHVFPESARGTGEGSKPWDLKPGSSMTNAMVSGVQQESGKGGSAGSSMTNATVSGEESAAGGKKLELTYKGEKKTVLVSPRTPVVALEPADRSAIRAGEHVFAVGPRQADGTVAAGRVYVGKSGVVPPM
ncbi:MAG TPA: hypothetical protein VF841_17995 [Anaeromyxobacter sp.]